MGGYVAENFLDEREYVGFDLPISCIISLRLDRQVKSTMKN